MSRLTHGLAWALLAFVASLGVTFSSTTAADDSPFWEKLQEKGLQIHGFASLTGVKTSANRFYGNSPDGSWDDIEVESSTAPPGSGGVVYLPYASPGGERAPFLDTAASASWMGMSLTTPTSQVLRSV